MCFECWVRVLSAAAFSEHKRKVNVPAAVGGGSGGSDRTPPCEENRRSNASDPVAVTHGGRTARAENANGRLPSASQAPVLANALAEVGQPTNLHRGVAAHSNGHAHAERLHTLREWQTESNEVALDVAAEADGRCKTFTF